MAQFNADIQLKVDSSAAERQVAKLDRNLGKIEKTTNDIFALDRKLIQQRRSLITLSGQQATAARNRIKDLSLQKQELALQKRELQQINRLEQRRLKAMPRNVAAQTPVSSSSGSGVNAVVASTSLFAANSVRTAARQLVIQKQSVDLVKKKEGFRRSELARLKGIAAAQARVDDIGNDRLSTLKKIDDASASIARQQKNIDSVNNSKNPDKTKNLFFGGVENRSPKQAFEDSKKSVAGLNNELDKNALKLQGQNAQYDEARRAVTELEGAERRRSAKLQTSLDAAIRKRRKEAAVEAKQEQRRKEFRAGLKNAAGVIGVVGGIAAAAQTARFISTSVKVAAAIQSQQIRLKALSEGYDDYQAVVRATEEAQGLFNQTQLEAAKGFGTAYSRLRPLGLSLEQIEAVYQGFNVAVINSGTTAAEASATFTQLTQALGAGALRGDELRSILEQTPGIASAIARELKVTVGDLKDYGKEGKISSETVLKALVAVRNEGVNKLSESLDTPVQKFKKLEIAGENLRVALADEALPAITEAVGNLAELIVSLEGPIRFISGLINKTLGGITDLINAATKSGEYGAAQSIKGGRIPFNVQATADLFRGTGPEGRGLQGLKDQAAELAKLRNQPQRDVLLQLMQDRLEAIENVRKRLADPLVINTDLSGVFSEDKTKLTEDKIKELADAAARLKAAQTDAANENDLVAFDKKIQDAIREGDKVNQTILEGERRILEIRQETGLALEGVTDELLKQAVFDKANAQVNRVLIETKTALLELEKDRTAELAEQAALAAQIVKTAASDTNNALGGRKKELGNVQNQIEFGDKGADFVRRVEDLVLNQGVSFQEAFDIESKLDAANKQLTEMRTNADFINGIGQTLQTGLVDAVSLAVTETDKLGESFKSLASDILAAIGKALILKAIQTGIGALAGGDGVGLFSILNGSFGGGRANGGPVSSGTTYLTGENGPELFIPGRDGQVISNDPFEAAVGALSGGTSGGDPFEENSEAIGVARSFAENNQSIATTNNYMRSQGQSSADQEALASMSNDSIDIRLEEVIINEMAFTTPEQTAKAVALGVKQARADVFRDLKNRPATRAQVGMR